MSLADAISQVLSGFTPVPMDRGVSLIRLIPVRAANTNVEDYLDYKEDLAFDQLCNSLNDVIIEFIRLYNEGSEVRIIDKMDNLRINVFT